MRVQTSKFILNSIKVLYYFILTVLKYVCLINLIKNLIEKCENILSPLAILQKFDHNN